MWGRCGEVRETYVEGTTIQIAPSRVRWKWCVLRVDMYGYRNRPKTEGSSATKEEAAEDAFKAALKLNDFLAKKISVALNAAKNYALEGL